MPVQYSGQSLLSEHIWTREHASIFDVSHMVQQTFSGREAGSFLETITPGSVKNMAVGTGKLSALLNDAGGIVDDCLVSRIAEDLWYVVTNAGRKKEDGDFFRHRLEDGGWQTRCKVKWKVAEDKAMVALQGPEAASAVASEEMAFRLKDGRRWNDFYFGEISPALMKLNNGIETEMLVSRGGYTGEDGFELGLIDAVHAAKVVESLILRGTRTVKLAGLGARDSLRLEAGMCLYGHDLDESVSPVEAGLNWIVPKERRVVDYEPQFPGLGTILEQIVPRSKGGKGVDRHRVGLVVEKGPPAREGAEIVNGEDNIGRITSGSFSPSLGTNIAMGYVKHGFQKVGTELEVLVRGRRRKATITKMPFVESKYYKKS